MVKQWLGIFWKLAVSIFTFIMLICAFAVLADSGHYIFAALLLTVVSAAVGSTVGVSLSDGERRM